MGSALAATGPINAVPIPTTAMTVATPMLSVGFHKTSKHSTFSTQSCTFDSAFMCCSSKGGQNKWFPCTAGTPPEDLALRLGKRDGCDQGNCWYDDQCWQCSPSGNPTASATTAATPPPCPTTTC